MLEISNESNHDQQRNYPKKKAAVSKSSICLLGLKSLLISLCFVKQCAICSLGCGLNMVTNLLSYLPSTAELFMKTAGFFEALLADGRRQCHVGQIAQ